MNAVWRYVTEGADIEGIERFDKWLLSPLEKPKPKRRLQAVAPRSTSAPLTDEQRARMAAVVDMGGEVFG